MGRRNILTGALLYFLLRFLDVPEQELSRGHDPKFWTPKVSNLQAQSNWSRTDEKYNTGRGPLELLPCMPSVRGSKVRGPCKVTTVLTMCEKTAPLKSVIVKNSQKLRFSFSRQYNQTLTLIKSIVVGMKHAQIRGLSAQEQEWIRTNVHLELFVISNNEDSVKSLQDTVASWTQNYTDKLHLIYQPAKYLKGYEWMENLYAPCSTLRLLLPQLLPQVDTLIYMDTDIILFQHILDLWNELVTFTPTTQVGMVRSRREFNSRPLVQRLGLVKIPAYNSGVMLMNITRLRHDTDWNTWLVQGCQSYEQFLQWADQDIMDVYFHIFSEKLHTLPCLWNFVPPFFVNQTLCDPTDAGAGILHGIGGHFFKPGRIGLLYKAFEQIDLDSRQAPFSLSRFVSKVKEDFRTSTTCHVMEETPNCDNNYFQEAIINKLDSYI